VLEDFKILTTFKLDLSDPNQQLSCFRFHHTHIPIIATVPAVGNQAAIPAIPYISDSMASLILLSALPQSADPTQDSVYTRMMEEYTSAHAVPAMSLDTLEAAIHNTWYSCFGGFPEANRPKKGTFYLMKQKQAPKNQKANVATESQKTTAIKDKGKTPQYSDQQKSGSCFRFLNIDQLLMGARSTIHGQNPPFP